ncbi:MAG TPA: hypothetical protein VGM34_01860 [Chlamydiales bacterium]|jgi:hypothetical protein
MAAVTMNSTSAATAASSSTTPATIAGSSQANDFVVQRMREMEAEVDKRSKEIEEKSILLNNSVEEYRKSKKRADAIATAVAASAAAFAIVSATVYLFMKKKG